MLIPTTVVLQSVVHRLPETTKYECRCCGLPIRNNNDAFGVYTAHLGNTDYGWFEFCSFECITLACRAGSC